MKVLNFVLAFTATAGMVSWFILIFRPDLFFLKLIISMGFGFSYGTAMVSWLLSDPIE